MQLFMLEAKAITFCVFFELYILKPILIFLFFTMLQCKTVIFCSTYFSRIHFAFQTLLMQILHFLHCKNRKSIRKALNVVVLNEIRCWCQNGCPKIYVISKKSKWIPLRFWDQSCTHNYGDQIMAELGTFFTPKIFRPHKKDSLSFLRAAPTFSSNLRRQNFCKRLRKKVYV